VMNNAQKEVCIYVCIHVCGQHSGEAENDSVEDDDRAKVMSSVDKIIDEHAVKLSDLRRQFANIDRVRIT